MEDTPRDPNPLKCLGQSVQTISSFPLGVVYSFSSRCIVHSFLLFRELDKYPPFGNAISLRLR